MHKDYLRHFGQEAEAAPRGRVSPESDSWQSRLQIDLANGIAAKWRKRGIITIVTSFLIVSAQAAWYYTHPKYVGIPIRAEEPYAESADLEAHIEEKFLHMAAVLKFLVDEVKKHDELFVRNTALPPKRAEYDLLASKIVDTGISKSPSFTKAVVTTSKANVRSLPNLSSEPIMTLDKGTELLVDLRQDEWNRVVTPTGQKAWMSAKVMELKGAS